LLGRKRLIGAAGRLQPWRRDHGARERDGDAVQKVAPRHVAAHPQLTVAGVHHLLLFTTAT
jgi:hypothetical protein